MRVGSRGAWRSFLVVLAGCGHATPAEPRASGPTEPVLAAERTFEVIAARCSDGPIDLEAGGIAMRVHVRGDLRDAPSFVVEESREADGCAATSIWRSEPSGEGRRFTEEVRVSYPPGSACDVFPEGTREGGIEGEADAPRWIVRRSRICGGLVATLRLAPLASAAPSPDALVRRWMADVVAGELEDAVARFDDLAVVVPPPVDEEAVPRRLEGREAIRAWHETSFASTSWRALRLVALDVDGPRAAFEWEYVDEATRREGSVRGRAELIASGETIVELRFVGVPALHARE